MVVVYTADQVLRRGLLLGGMSDFRQKKQKRDENIADFKALYGVHPTVLAEIWVDLQTTTVQAARIDPTAPYQKRTINLKNFFRAVHFLMRYPTERERKVATGNTQKTIRKYTWFFLQKIHALKATKVCAERLAIAVPPHNNKISKNYLFRSNFALHTPDCLAC